ncbi:MAG TPA: hypothetical protein VHM01_12605 [Alphaproteobacteria bacterium]|nr:hypothetical protein [Alphaproteobacteria bacterium]
MKVDSNPSVHSFHYTQPRALENGKGKAADSPAFQARAGLGESGEVQFGKLVSEIAKARKDAASDAGTPDTPTTPDLPIEV